MVQKLNKQAIWGVVIIGLVFLLDQVTKAIALTFKTTFRPVGNTGITFGFFQGANTVMIFISIIALGIVLWMLRTAKQEERFGLFLLISGILGNFVDRAFRGAVVDFIRVGSFPVFNIADSAIVGGIIYLLLLEFPTFRSYIIQNSSKSSSSSK